MWRNTSPRGRTKPDNLCKGSCSDRRRYTAASGYRRVRPFFTNETNQLQSSSMALSLSSILTFTNFERQIRRNGAGPSSTTGPRYRPVSELPRSIKISWALICTMRHMTMTNLTSLWTGTETSILARWSAISIGKESPPLVIYVCL